MAKNLNLVGLKYNTAAAVFFIPYALAEVPSNIALRIFRPSRWLPSIMMSWGLVMTLMCLVNSYTGLIVARLFLGLAESGLFPGVAYYLSLWYPRSAQSKRIAIFFSAATVAGAFGGLLAYGIERMEGVGGLHGWQWIFCLEGIVTFIVACVSYFILHDDPETATFLTETERTYIIAMLKADSQNMPTHLSKKFVWQAIADYKTYVQVGIYLGNLIPIYAFALFIPTIIKEMGYSSANAQLLTVPPYAVGCLGTILVGIYSDKYQLRGPFIIGGSTVALIGYVILYTRGTAGVGYVGTILAAVGAFPTIAPNLAWAGGNAGGVTKRGVVLALVIGLSNLGGICSSFVYIDPPHFHKGHGTILGVLSLSIILSFFAMWNYSRLNKQKEALCAREGITASREDEFKDMADDSPLFRYSI
jgi:MFS family permease